MEGDDGQKFSSPLSYLRDSLGEEKRLEELRQIAYDLYDKKGKRPGTEFASWLEAAQILKSRK